MRQIISLGRSVVQHHTRMPLRISNRKSHYMGYREINYEPGRHWKKPMAEFLAGVMWWWVGWHFMTDWRHLVGEFVTPNYSDWSDEELGIPPD